MTEFCFGKKIALSWIFYALYYQIFSAIISKSYDLTSAKRLIEIARQPMPALGYNVQRPYLYRVLAF